jgi:hypothetical protein
MRRCERADAAFGELGDVLHRAAHDAPAGGEEAREQPVEIHGRVDRNRTELDPALRFGRERVVRDVLKLQMGEWEGGRNCTGGLTSGMCSRSCGRGIASA